MDKEQLKRHIRNSDLTAVEKRYLEGLVDGTRWIPCSERMPLPGLTVHVFAVQNDGCEMFFDAYYSEGAGIWSTYDSTAKESDRFSHAVSPLIKITHWMPIADKPEGV